MNDKELREFTKFIFGEDIFFCPIEKLEPITPAPCMTSMERPRPKKNKYEFVSLLANKEKGAFTVVWADGTHTVIHIQDGDNWDDEKALAMCFVKKMMDNKGSFNDIFTKEMPAKLKTIEKKEEPKKEIPTTEAFAQAAKSATTSVNEAANAMSEMVKKMTTNPIYTVSHRNIMTGESEELLTTTNKVDVQVFVSNWQKKKKCQGYTRCWMNNSKLIIDYGSHSHYLVVDGMTMEDYINM